MEPGPQSVCIDLQPHDGKVQGGRDALYSACPPYAAQGFPAERLPSDFVLWSIFNTVFCNVCCLGFAALVFSFKARDRKLLGDASGAESYGKTAKGLNITVSILAGVLFIAILVTVILTVRAVSYQRNPYGY